MSRFPKIRKAISYAAKAGAVKNAYRDARSSLSAAQKRGKKAMGFARRIKKDFRKGLADFGQLERKLGFRRAKRPPKRVASDTSATAVRMGYAIPRGKSRVSKKRKPKRVFKGVTRNFDDHGQIAKGNAAYLVFQNHGSYDRVFTIIAEALCKAACALLRVYPASFDEPLPILDESYVPSMVIKYRRINDDGTSGTIDGAHVSFKNSSGDIRTFTEFASVVKQQIQEAADAPGDTGYYPQELLWKQATPSSGIASVSARSMVLRSLGDAKISLFVKQVIRLQNVTPNDSGTSVDTSHADRNPIRGKCYGTSGNIPRVRDALLAAHPEFDDFQRNVDVGVWHGPNVTEDGPITHPPPAKQLFLNSTSVQDVRMPAGGQMSKHTYFKYSATLRSLINRVYKTGIMKTSFGDCTTYGFEPEFRRTGAANTNVTLNINREVHMSATLRLVTKVPMLQKYDQTPVSFT